MKNLLFLLSLYCLTMVQAQDQIVRVGGIKQGSFAMGSNGNYLLTGSYGSSTLRCYDISNPAVPQFTDSIILNGDLSSITFNNTFALVGGSWFVSLINMSNPQNLSITATLPISGQVHSLYFHNDMLYALRAENNTNFRLLRIGVSLPGGLSLIDSLSIPEMVTKMVGTADGRIFLARVLAFNPNTVQILNISGGGFTTLGSIPSVGASFNSFDVLGNTLYMNYADSMRIINISDPANPQTTDVIPTPYGSDMQALDANRFGFSQYLSCYGAYWNGGSVTESVFNSSNYWLATAKSYPYIFYSVSDSIHILSFSSLWNSTPQLHENQLVLYPNPVTDMLYVSGDVTYESQYTIYNLLGQPVQSNRFSTAIDVRSLHRGTYFISITNGDNTVVKGFVVER